MGDDSDQPRPGWTHGVSFTGQGSYFPDTPEGGKARLNVDGKRVPQTTYVTDELTENALRWLRELQGGAAPWMLYLSHKAVHFPFTPAPRHAGRYTQAPVKPWPSSAGTPQDELMPMWARNQRNSWHGAEYPFPDTLGQADDIYRRYCETLLAVDESTQRLIDFLRDTHQLESTLIIYMGDNGHPWGGNGVIDKRTAYEGSIRVPLIVQCPEIVPAGRVVNEIVANLDIAPTVLDAAGIKPPATYQGRSFFPLARGVWDVAELYDIGNDPHEFNNLYAQPGQHQRAMVMDKRLFELLAETGGTSIPLLRGWEGSAKEERSPHVSGWAPFPRSMTARIRSRRQRRNRSETLTPSSEVS